MVQALMDVELTYDHIPGKDNDVADALSRAHLGPAHEHRASDFITKYCLVSIDPCMYFADNEDIRLPSRQAHTGSLREGRPEADDGESTRNTGQPLLHGISVHSIHGQGGRRPIGPHTPTNMRIHGVHGATYPCPSHYQKQAVPCKDLPADDGGSDFASRPPQGETRHGRIFQGQNVHFKGEVGAPSRVLDKGLECYSANSGQRGGAGSDIGNLLRGPQAIRGRPPQYKGVQPSTTPHTQGHCFLTAGGSPYHQMGQKPTAGGTGEEGSTPMGAGHKGVPRDCIIHKHGGRPDRGRHRPLDHVPGDQDPCALHTNQENVGHGPEQDRGQYQRALTAQYKKDSRLHSPCQGLFGLRDSTTWGLEVECISDIYRHPNWKGHGSTRRLY